MKTGMVCKRSNRWINLLVEPSHVLFDMGMNTVPKFARTLILGLIVGTARGLPTAPSFSRASSISALLTVNGGMRRMAWGLTGLNKWGTIGSRNSVRLVDK